MIRAGLLAVALSLAAALHAQPAPLPVPPPAPDVRYVMKPGDTLMGLAAAYLVRPAEYRAVATLNGVRDVYRIPIGTMLTIPRPLLRTGPAIARIASFRGQVSIGGDPVKFGAPLREGMQIETGPNSALSFVMADRTLVSLPSQSHLTIRRLRRILLTGETERQFLLVAGRSNWSVTPTTNRANRFEVRTPVAVAAVRGTEFRVTFDGDAGKAATETLRGAVGVSAPVGAVDLPAGFGAISTAASAGTAIALLKPPAIVTPIPMEADGTQVVMIRSAPGETRYRVQIARDAAFADLRAEIESGERIVRLPPLPDGRYFLRVTAFDANGLEGLPAIFNYDHAQRLRAPGGG